MPSAIYFIMLLVSAFLLSQGVQTVKLHSNARNLELYIRSQIQLSFCCCGFSIFFVVYSHAHTLNYYQYLF